VNKKEINGRAAWKCCGYAEWDYEWDICTSNLHKSITGNILELLEAVYLEIIKYN